MNTTDLMRDPFYAQILFEIEGQVLATDRAAKSRGIELTDSQVRSILNKVRKSATGSSPKIETVSVRDQVLADLYKELLRVKASILVETEEGNSEELSTDDWVLSLRAVEDSIRLRSIGSGSRAYLIFLEGFLSRGP
jgi:hypothetical protein